jgi:protein-disulfide isomerase
MKFLFILLLALTLSACNNETTEDPLVKAVSVEVPPEVVEISPVSEANVVKFFDYACGHCRTSHFSVKNLKAEFGDKVTFTLKHYPLSPATYLVAETAECARRQNKFEVYHDTLFEENFQNYAPENLQAVAESVGIDIDQFNTCVANGGGRSAVQADVDEATALGVSGTPYFLINNSIPLPGVIPEQSFSRLIKGVLAGEVR